MDGGKSWPRAGHGAAAAGDAEAPAHHLLIAGTGRAGTSFLVRYLSALGLDTNLARRGDNAVWDDRANAGLEDLLLPDPSRLPYVVKSPWTHEFIEELLHCGKVRLDAVILPMRDLVEAAASRATLEMQAAHRELPWMARLEHTWESFRHTAGGIVYSMSPIDQARLLAVGFHRILEQLVQADVPVVLMSFPRFVEDADYLFDKLAPVLGAGVSRDAARQAHAALADPAKVRVGRELQSATEAAPGLTLRGPSLVQLDRAALARTLTETRRQVETITEARLHADQKRDELAQDLERATATVRNIGAQKAAVEQQLLQATRTADTMRVEISHRAQHADTLAREADALRAELAALRASLATALAETAAIADRLGGIEASTSWRVATTAQRLVTRVPGLARMLRHGLGRRPPG